MKIQVKSESSKTSFVELSKKWDDASEYVSHQVLVAGLANKREGTACTKTKNEVAGGGKKPWKQKGLGRARAGSSRSPLWKGGGVTFGPKPRDYTKKVNKKQRALAYMWLFKKMNEDNSLIVLEELKFESLKTKEMVKFVDSLVEKSDKVMIITENYNKKLLLSSRNLKNVSVYSYDLIDFVKMVYTDKIVIERKALEALNLKYEKILNIGDEDAQTK